MLSQSFALLWIHIHKQASALDITMEFWPWRMFAGGFVSMAVVLLHENRTMLTRCICHENMVRVFTKVVHVAADSERVTLCCSMQLFL